jgi:hypothetical protein
LCDRLIHRWRYDSLDPNEHRPKSQGWTSCISGSNIQVFFSFSLIHASLRVAVGSLAFFSFLLTQFARITRIQFSKPSADISSLQIPNSDDSASFTGAVMWLIHMLFGIEHFTSPTAENDGTIVSGTYWVPTPSGQPLAMLIPGFLLGAVGESFIR